MTGWESALERDSAPSQESTEDDSSKAIAVKEEGEEGGSMIELRLSQGAKDLSASKLDASSTYSTTIYFWQLHEAEFVSPRLLCAFIAAILISSQYGEDSARLLVE